VVCVNVVTIWYGGDIPRAFGEYEQPLFDRPGRGSRYWWRAVRADRAVRERLLPFGWCLLRRVPVAPVFGYTIFDHHRAVRAVPAAYL